GEPLAIQTAHIPLVLAPGLAREHLDQASLYDLLRGKYGLEPAKARETYSAVAVDPGAAQLLRIPAGAPVFGVERITFLADGKPLEFVQSVTRGDRYHVVLELAAHRKPQAMRV